MTKFKSIAIVYWILVVLGWIGWFLMLTGWSYPVTQVAKPLHECKSVHWDKMPEWCVIDIPKITNNDKQAYQDKDLYQLIYSNLWGWSYQNGWDVLSGGSPGMDIVSSKGTPVYVIGDGEVVQAWYRWWIGNSITVKHRYNDSYIYSSYSHLDEMFVSVGDAVKEWTLIGKIGNTWTTFGQYGNHLDFQITTTNQLFYPYSYHDCSVGLSYYDIVNSSVCRSLMQANTMDPLILLEWGLSRTTDRIVSRTPLRRPLDTIVSGSTNTKQVNVALDVDLPDMVHESAPVVLPASQSSSAPWVQRYQYQVLGLSDYETIQTRRQFVFFIKVDNLTSKLPHHGILPHRIIVRDSEWVVWFSAPVISRAQQWVIKVTGMGLRTWKTTLHVEVAGKSLGSFSANFVNK